MFCIELQRIFSDKGIIIIFFLAGLVYPILYSYIYGKENLTDVPVAVVDLDHSADSRRFIQKLDATPEVKVMYHCASMEEAKQLFKHHRINGIVYFPNDYDNKLASLDQAYVSLYCDMSSFLYYRAVYMGANYVMLDEMRNIELRRYNALGIVDESASQLVEDITSEEVTMFSPSDGFSSFLLPCVLILILHQTLFFGVCMMCGTAYEEGKHYIPQNITSHDTYRVVIGRALAYFVIYAGLAFYSLMLMPKVFNLPHTGNFATLASFMVPFILAAIFFSMTIGSFIRNREISLIMFAPFTIILLFLSGFSWPTANMPLFWRSFAYLFPSTFGIQGYIGINTMGASLSQMHIQYLALWIQTGFYFITSCLTLRMVKGKL